MDVLGHFVMYGNVLGVYWDVLECFRTFRGFHWDILKHFGLFGDVFGHFMGAFGHLGMFREV